LSPRFLTGGNTSTLPTNDRQPGSMKSVAKTRRWIMKYSTARQGRTFVIRLEDGDIVHEEIERLALEEKVKAGFLVILGGADQGSSLVVGPEKSRGVSPVTPMNHVIDDTHEVAGTGTLFPDDTGRPVLHMHMACGRETHTVTGCIRGGVKVWHVMEAVLVELLDTNATRALDPATGFKLLAP
jgi:predicted DNA-binding protein with PD1-like motif